MERSEVMQRLAIVRARIEAAMVAAGRGDGAVELLAVSKFHPASSMRAAYDAGQRAFGESRVQELAQKAREVADLADVQWHMIGSLQTNKAKELLGVPGLVMLHTLDRAGLADELQKELSERGTKLRALVQVHATEETTKHGCRPNQVRALLAHVGAKCPSIAVEGLMAMGPLEGDPASTFSVVHALLHELRTETGLPLPVLSLGMSGDLESAVLHGSTMVRVGTDIFGARA